MADNEGGQIIKILSIEDTKHNPFWGGLAQILGALAFVITVVGLAFSVKMCNSDLETISRAWHGQLQCIEEDENE